MGHEGNGSDDGRIAVLGIGSSPGKTNVMAAAAVRALAPDAVHSIHVSAASRDPEAAAVRLLARGRITATGVHPPELCIEPDDLFAELERRGCAFHTEVREVAPAYPAGTQ